LDLRRASDRQLHDELVDRRREVGAMSQVVDPTYGDTGYTT
jgi:hypothetical protein